ncbi:MAG: type IV secretion system DNA-binding domain-containing protein, partial [Devosia sp.]|nr:type IV secretion system DNA-binding domain-containing protein [Devosia sp.]
MLKKAMLPVMAALLLASTSPVWAAGELTYVVNNESAKYDPGTTAETFATPIIGNAFEGLVKYASDGAIVPALAESWTISEDGLTYTFEIRADAKWSDGKPVTAGDFVYAWKRVLTPASGAMNAPMLYSIAGAEEYFADQSKDNVALSATDDKTLTFTLKQRVPYMMQLLGFSTFYPVREDIVSADPEGWTTKPETYIGTGPFKVTAMNFGESVVLEKNPEYYNAANVSLDKLTFRLIPDPAESDPFWALAGRMVLKDVIAVLGREGRRTNRDLYNAIAKSNLDAMHALLQGTAGATYVDPTTERTGMSLKMTVQ